MSARRKNVRSQVNEIEIEIDSTDKICKVVDLKGANMIEVLKQCGRRTLVRIPSRFANIYYVRKGSYIICCGFCDEDEAEAEAEDAILIRRDDATEKNVDLAAVAVAEGGSRVTGELKRVLTIEQIKALKREVPSKWPEIFQTTTAVALNDDQDGNIYVEKDDALQTMTPDALLKIEEKLRESAIGCTKKSKRAATNVTTTTRLQKNKDDDCSTTKTDTVAENEEDDLDDDEASDESDDSLPPLHRNTNRRKIVVDDSDSDDDSV